MVHKEETLVCPSVKYADQISQCKQIHCKDCREKELQTNKKVEQLEKRLKIMTIVGAVAATAVGKDLLDKVIASFGNVTDSAAKIEESAKSIGGTDSAPPSGATSRRWMKPRELPIGSGNPYQVDGNRSAYVTELDTPFAMDPSWDKTAPAYREVNLVFKTPRAVAANTDFYELPIQEPQGVRNMGMNMPIARQFAPYAPVLRSYVSDSPFGGYDNDQPAFGSFAVPAASTAFVFLGIGIFKRRAR